MEIRDEDTVFVNEKTASLVVKDLEVRYEMKYVISVEPRRHQDRRRIATGLFVNMLQEK